MNPKRLALDDPRRTKAVETFIEALESTGSVGRACVAARITIAVAVVWRGQDELLNTAWTQAESVRPMYLEDAAYQRAVIGTTEWGEDAQGNLYAKSVKHSDSLLIELLRAKNPAEYGQKLDVNGSLSDAVLSRIAELTALAKARKNSGDI